MMELTETSVLQYEMSNKAHFHTNWQPHRIRIRTVVTHFATSVATRTAHENFV
jgi:hypothetical protein